MTDVIRIRDLRVEAHIGVTDEERARPQWLLISLDVFGDFRVAGASDDLQDAVDYGTLVSDVAGLVRTTHVKLLERLGEVIAGALLASKRVERVFVDIAKEAPPVEEDVGRLSVAIERP